MEKWATLFAPCVTGVFHHLNRNIYREFKTRPVVLSISYRGAATLISLFDVCLIAAAVPML
jgi:hypothetical protein